MAVTTHWDKAGVIAAIAGVGVSIVSVIIASGWVTHSYICVTATYISGQPASDAVLVHSKDKPIIADSFGRFVCPAHWVGSPATICDPTGHPLVQILAILPDSRIHIDIAPETQVVAVGLPQASLDDTNPTVRRGKQSAKNRADTHTDNRSNSSPASGSTGTKQSNGSVGGNHNTQLPKASAQQIHDPTPTNRATAHSEGIPPAPQQPMAVGPAQTVTMSHAHTLRSTAENKHKQRPTSPK
jgi:hypothetical protein